MEKLNANTNKDLLNELYHFNMINELSESINHLPQNEIRDEINEASEYFWDEINNKTSIIYKEEYGRPACTDNEDITPEIGMRVTCTTHKTCYPATIVEVSKNGKKLTVQADKVTTINNSDEHGLDTYEIETDVNGELEVWSIRKDNRYNIVSTELNYNNDIQLNESRARGLNKPKNTMMTEYKTSLKAA